MGLPKKIAAISLVALSRLLIAYGTTVAPRHSSSGPASPQRLLDKADGLFWTNRWALARPVYAQAAAIFRKQNRPAEALYAEVSELPADESTSVAAKILLLNAALDTEAARDPKTHL